MTAGGARARANVALAKYWGKRDEELNLPFTGSISLTLDGLHTDATVALRSRQAADVVTMNGWPAPASEARRVSRFFDLVRQQARSAARVDVDLRSNFPVAAGLASSASTFAALAV